ncbi:Gfo/Idh/MocA family protein [Actinoplanes subtropicus]|uniref:Gfo/Idh/MocA family protein n=1 Tax=Actinoplanes subtropicus TaxID=543632 RepID=UPI000A00BA79|nr:Gfo/Idh/MocA family oxidoreductase [Actinoplanes subtropicus]
MIPAARFAPAVVPPAERGIDTVTRVAVVGTGPWWGLQHAQTFAGRPDTRLVAVVGRDPGRTAARATPLGATPYVDLDEMLAAESPDLVAVCLPNEGHFEPTLRLIRAGVPLLVEKPLTFAVSEGRQLIAEARHRDLFLAINFNHRYARPVQLAAAAIARGDLGEPVFATWRFGGEPGTSAHPYANLIETQCHGFDMLEHLCGPIDSVAAQVTGDRATLAVALHFASGAVGTLLGSYDSSYTYPGTHLLEVNGTRGRVLVEDTVRRYTFNRAGDETAQVWQAGYFNDTDRDFHATFDRHLDDLLPALREGGAPPVPATAGLRALLLAEAVIRSAETGRREAVPDDEAPAR